MFLFTSANDIYIYIISKSFFLFDRALTPVYRISKFQITPKCVYFSHKCVYFAPKCVIIKILADFIANNVFSFIWTPYPGNRHSWA